MFKRLGFLAQKPVTGFFLAFFLTSLVTIAAAETMMLKTLVINPSKEKEQEVPIRSYLPAEAKPEIVVNREDLQIGFDTGK